MSERYDEATAQHYVAYRPPLHQIALAKLLDKSERFLSGFDFGCGTGYSAIALTDYCDHVVAVDNSESMLTSATPHPNVTYKRGGIHEIQSFIPKNCKLITFAGSLFYTKSEDLRSQLLRVCSSESNILIYDFDLLLDDILENLKITPFSIKSSYSHDIGLNDWKEFNEFTNISTEISLKVTTEQLAHILLSDSSRYDALSTKYSHLTVFEPLFAELDQLNISTIPAKIWAKRYQIR